MPAKKATALFGHDFDRFVSFLTNDGKSALISPARFAEALGLADKLLASKAKVHVDTLARSPNAENIQFFLVESIRVLHAAAAGADGIEPACTWFRKAKLAQFEGAAPIDLVSQGRTEELLACLAKGPAALAA